MRSPTVWAIHTYGGMGVGRIDSLRAFKTATAAGSPSIWVTETGPRFGWRNASPAPDATAVAAHYQDWMDAFAAVSSRVTRFYLYEFQADPNWDTGLIPLPGGDPSTALNSRS